MVSPLRKFTVVGVSSLLTLLLLVLIEHCDVDAGIPPTPFLRPLTNANAAKAARALWKARAELKKLTDKATSAAVDLN